MTVRKLALWIVLLLLLVGCRRNAETSLDHGGQLMLFYPCESTQILVSETGLLAKEMRDFGSELPAWKDLLQILLDGPKEVGLRNPFPDGLSVELAELREGTLYIQMNRQWDFLSPMELHLAQACIVMTAEQFSSVDDVCVFSVQTEKKGIRKEILRRESFLLYDDFATNDHLQVKIYFSDKNGRYLVEENRSRSGGDTDTLPQFIIEQLLLGPQKEGSLPVLPEGTSLLQSNVKDGICTLNFSGEFVSNGPDTHMQSRMTVFAVVNSLTELPQITEVQFRCLGAPVKEYGGMDLSQPVCREELALMPGSGNEIEGTIYIPCGTEGFVAAVPINLRRNPGKDEVDMLIGALLNFQEGNGYYNPFPDGTILLDHSMEKGTCTVLFNNRFALLQAESLEFRQAVRAITSTLCQLDGIGEVKLEAEGSKDRFRSISETAVNASSWIIP